MVDLAAGFSDRIAVLTRGSLAVYDTVADLKRDPRELDALLTSRRR